MNTDKEKSRKFRFREWEKVIVGTLAILIVFSFFISLSHRLVVFRSDFLAEIFPKVLVDLTNFQRQTNQTVGLKINPLLEEAARQKAEDMAQKGYFAHNSPEGVTPWYWFRAAGYDFIYAGENLAINFSDSSDVVRAWMDSPGHRSNILNQQFTEIGIATAKGNYQGRPTTFVVQMFGRPTIQLSPLSPSPELALFTPSSEDNETGEEEVLGSQEEIEEPGVRELEKVENEEEKFMAVEKLEAQEESPEESKEGSGIQEEPEEASGIQEEATAVAGETGRYSSDIEKLLASPSLLLSIVYFFLGGIILFLMTVVFLLEIKKRHYLHIIYGAGLIFLIVVMYLAYQSISSKIKVSTSSTSTSLSLSQHEETYRYLPKL